MSGYFCNIGKTKFYLDVDLSRPLFYWIFKPETFKLHSVKLKMTFYKVSFHIRANLFVWREKISTVEKDFICQQNIVDIVSAGSRLVSHLERGAVLTLVLVRVGAIWGLLTRGNVLHVQTHRRAGHHHDHWLLHLRGLFLHDVLLSFFPI